MWISTVADISEILCKSEVASATFLVAFTVCYDKLFSGVASFRRDSGGKLSSLRILAV